MNLSSTNSYQNTGIDQLRGTTGTTDLAAANNVKNAEDLRNLQPGQTIQGEIVSRNGNEVVINIGNDQLINARLDNAASLLEGQTVLFAVKSNSNAKLALSPLFENMGQDANALKALNAASLPVNQKMVSMVAAMMEEGLPIDKNSLLAMGKQVTMNAGTNPVTLAQMQRLQIPITPENILSFEAYKNYEHQMTESLMEITQGLTDTLEQMAAAGQTKEAVAFYTDVLQLVADQTSGDASTLQTMTNQTMQQTQSAEQQQTSAIAENVTAVETALTETGLSEQNNALNPTQVTADSQISQAVIEQAQSAEASPQQVFQQVEAGTLRALLDMTSGGREQAGTENLAALLEEAGVPRNFTSQIAQGEMTPEQFFKQLNAIIREQPQILDSPKMLEVFSSKEYNQLLKAQISNEWLLEPQAVEDKQQVQQLYNRLNEQTNRLLQALEQVSKGDSPLAKSVTNLSNNLDFMNQLNQTFAYVQLPLKMSGEATHGELYVYTNKKNLAKKEGQVSALLHLDMEHLGPVDVYVAMQNQNVSTKFYLQDDATLDLVMNHIHVLNERLEKRGYSMQCEMIQRNQETNVMEEILETDKNISVLSNYSFDARA